MRSQRSEVTQKLGARRAACVCNSTQDKLVYEADFGMFFRFWHAQRDAHRVPPICQDQPRDGRQKPASAGIISTLRTRESPDLRAIMS
jgi:hypothetical protein